MKISVASGKGGTGKTFVALNLAVSLNEEIHLVDCDVEEPNLHLFLKPHISEREDVFVAVPEVLGEECSQCKRCVEVCAFHAISLLNGRLCIFEELCHSCGACILFCPKNVLKARGRPIGVRERGYRGKVMFYQGILNPGEPLAPPLISSVKERWERSGDSIFDAPPGTSCPVVETIKGSDYVLLVTEPTPFGLHDLELAVLMCRRLEIPCGLVINRSTIGDERTREFAEREGLPILLSIPYDEEIARTCAKGEILVEEHLYWREPFLNLWKRIREEAQR